MNTRKPGRGSKPAAPPPPPSSRSASERGDDEEILSRRLSREDVQELARMSSELVRRTLLSGVDVVRDVGRELPKEATQFLNARKEQVLQTFSREFTESLINATMDRFFRMLREHRVDVSFRLVRDTPNGKADLTVRRQKVEADRDPEESVAAPKEKSEGREDVRARGGRDAKAPESMDGMSSRVSYADAVSAIAERLARDVVSLRKSSKDK